MDTTKQSPVILSLCTGLLRGLEVGIEAAIQRKVRIAAYSEIEAFAVENLLCGMEKGILDPAPIWTDLKTFPFEKFRGKIHGITGGYPCQPFSNAGKRAGTEDPRHLWPYIREGVRAAKPLFVFFENVEGHLSLGFEEVSRDLRNLGYRVEAGIFSAEEVGAPHQRKRLFILGVLDYSSGNGFKQIYKILPRRNSVIDAGQELANAPFFGIQGSGRNWEQEPRSYAGEGLLVRGSGEFTWPARPGEAQHADEPPRVESSMGYKIDGYNFREDLLRGIGNGVVWQTAELAFKVLVEKLFS